MSLARPVIEAAADTHLLIGVDTKRDPLPRFYAGRLRELIRENDSFEWVDRYDPDAVNDFKNTWTVVVEIGPRLGLTLQYGTRARQSRLVGRMPDSIITSRGKSIPIDPVRSSMLGSVSADLLQSWRIASGAAHASPWLTGGEFLRFDTNRHNPDPWKMAMRSAASAIDDICTLNVKFLGLATE